MKYKILSALCCGFLLFSLMGCQLALKDAGENQDRLIGMFVTTEYLDLFDTEGYITDNAPFLTGGETIVDTSNPKYHGKLYATLTQKTSTEEETRETSTTEEYIFPVDGICFFSALMPETQTEESYYNGILDPGISNGAIHYNMAEDENITTLDGTLYITPSKAEQVYYFNPVYQSTDGSVYAVAGGGFSVDSSSYSEGSVFSQTLTDTTTITKNGKKQTESIYCTLSLNSMYAAQTIVVLQMDKDSTLLACTEYTPGAMPASIPLLPQTSYLLVETHSLDASGQPQISRAVYNSDAENIQTFYTREDGVCVKQDTPIAR